CHDWIADADPVRQPSADPLLHRRDELARNHAADDVVLELEPLAARQGGQLDPAVAVLAVTARLPLVLALRLRASPDGLLVRHLRRLQLHLDAELALQPLDGD